MVTIYTAIFGDYDTLKEPRVVNPRIKYVCFTDQDFESDTWEIRKMKCRLTPRRQARKVKILSHQFIEDKKSLWIDGNILLKKNPLPYLRKFKEQMLLTKHFNRDCIYDEYKKVISNGKAIKDIAKKQIERYEKDGYPKHNGLVETTMLYRKMNPEVEQFENLWWNEVKTGSRRDQLSFNYLAWKHDFSYGIFRWRIIGKRLHHK